MIRNLWMFEKWLLRGEVIETNSPLSVFMSGKQKIKPFFAEYNTSWVSKDGEVIWLTTVMIDCKTIETLLSELVDYQGKRQFQRALGWERYWTRVWLNPTFTLIPRFIVGRT